MRGSSDLRPLPTLHLLINKGGLGDSVARMPAIKYILQTFQHVELIRLFVQDYFVDYANHVLQPYATKTKLEVYSYSKMREILEKYPNAAGMMVDSDHHTTLRTHLTNHAFHTLVDVQPEPTWLNYVPMRPAEIDVKHLLPAGPFVVVTTGFTAAVRELLPEYINDITAFIRRRGYQVVFLGQKQSDFFKGVQAPTEATFRPEINFNRGLDLRDKTTLLEAGAIMAKAEAVVGLDNGLLHLAATASETLPIVAGYTTVDPKHRMPYRNNRLGYAVYPVHLGDKELACTFCQTQMGFVYEFDFRRCYYGDYACIKQLTSSRYTSKLKYILKQRG